jgi:predicted dehydrogenase
MLLPYHPIRQFSNLTTEQILANASHEIDILQSLLGDISAVYAVEGPKERGYAVEETVQVVFTFASGVVGSFLFSEYVSCIPLGHAQRRAHTGHGSTIMSPHSWEAATGENPHIPSSGETCLTVFGTKGTIGIPSL